MFRQRLANDVSPRGIVNGLGHLSQFRRVFDMRFSILSRRHFSCTHSLRDRLETPTDTVMDRKTEPAVMDEDICWICLEGSTPQHPLHSPCECPRKVITISLGASCRQTFMQVHEACLARWQLQQAGKTEEQVCRFCFKPLPDWRPKMTPICLKEEITAAKPTMMVTFRKKVCYVPVTPGPNGLRDFTRSIREKFGLKEDANINVSFGCREPLTGSYLKLEGHGAFDAAVHCASISAASRERQRHGLPPVENTVYCSPSGRSSSAESSS